jgi:NAD(P)-dependent dehydrogenase (short-subunit alcohol dehydrogenase family)
MAGVRYGLEGATVVVTGAAAGIGLGIARAFAGQGARLALVDRDADALATAARSMEGATQVTPVVADLNDEADVSRAAGAIAAAFGRVRILVNNAGTEYPTPLDDPAHEAGARWQWLLDNNLGSMMRVSRALLPRLADNGVIINQASIWGHSAVGGFSAYVASKHAVIGFTRSLAWELAPRGIRVNAVCPGWVRTGASMNSLRAMAAERGLPEDVVLAGVLENQAFPRLLEPADVAGAFLFLASDDARSITGQSLVVSNGELMH